MSSSAYPPPSGYGQRPRYSYDGSNGRGGRYTQSPLSSSSNVHGASSSTGNGGNRRHSMDPQHFHNQVHNSRPPSRAMDHYSRPPSRAWQQQQQQQHRPITPAMTDHEYYEERRLGDFTADQAARLDAMDSVSAIHDHQEGEEVTAQFYHPPPGAYDHYYSPRRSQPGPPTSYSWPEQQQQSPHYNTGQYYPSAASEPGIGQQQYPTSAQMYDDPYAAEGPGYFYQPPIRPQSVASSSAYTLTHPPALYPASPVSETPPAIFGIHADHHAGSNGKPRREHLPSFPSWSRHWYDGHLSANGHAYTSVPPPDGASGWESETLTRSGKSPRRGGRYSADFVKEERMRMLEKQFGKPKVKHRGDGEDEEEEQGEENGEPPYDPDAELSPGQVTSKGSIKMHWAKTYLTLKVLAMLFALVAVVTGVALVLMIKPSTDSIPAIKSSPTGYILHVASLLSLVVLSYLFLFRPCCCDPARSAAKRKGLQGPEQGNAGGLGGMIIPVISGGVGGNGPKRGFFGRKKNKFGHAEGHQPMGTTVNLIVDPSMLTQTQGGKRKQKRRKDHGYSSASSNDSSDDDDDEGPDLPGNFRNGKRRLNPLESMQQRRLQNLAIESFKKSLTILTLFTILLLILIVLLFVFSKGKAINCVSNGSSWCLVWKLELASNILIVIALFAILVLGWWGYRKSRRAGGRISGP
ncbi:unnamed protein product [Sympodiomycopsis kandeliae]